eukprot:COSAG01_NODE_2962_length_6786_cov_21.580544_10_plen_220_part_00
MRLFLCPIHFFTSLSLIPVSGGVPESELPEPLTHAPRSRGLQTGEWRSLRAGRPLSRGEDAVPDGCIDPSIGSPNVTPFGDNRPTYTRWATAATSSKPTASPTQQNATPNIIFPSLPPSLSQDGRPSPRAVRRPARRGTPARRLCRPRLLLLGAPRSPARQLLSPRSDHFQRQPSLPLCTPLALNDGTPGSLGKPHYSTFHHRAHHSARRAGEARPRCY